MAERLKNVEFLLNIWRTRRIRNIRLGRRLKGKTAQKIQKKKENERKREEKQSWLKQNQTKQNNKTTKVNTEKEGVQQIQKTRWHKIKWKLHGVRGELACYKGAYVF